MISGVSPNYRRTGAVVHPSSIGLIAWSMMSIHSLTITHSSPMILSHVKIISEEYFELIYVKFNSCWHKSHPAHSLLWRGTHRHDSQASSDTRTNKRAAAMVWSRMMEGMKGKGRKSIGSRFAAVNSVAPFGRQMVKALPKYRRLHIQICLLDNDMTKW